MWHHRIVYYRDFAYNSRRLRMANGSIGDVTAAIFAELLSGSMIDVYVGEAKRHWSLHCNLLCHHSELLENEIEGDGQGNAKKEKLELLDFDPAGFELLVKWLYQGKLDDVSDMADANQKYEYAVSCYKLYLLCGRLGIPQLKNIAMDQYRKGLNEAGLVPDAEEIDEIYRKSPVGSPFKQLMARIAARQIMDPGSERDVQTYRQCFENNPDFAVHLVKAIKRGTGGMLFQDPTDLGDPCLYHDHGDGPNCHIKGKDKVKKDPNSVSKPIIHQINPLHKLRPARPPSPPASSKDTSPAFSPSSCPSGRNEREPSPPSPQRSGEFDSWYITREGDTQSVTQSGRLEGQGKVAEGDVTGEKEAGPRAESSSGKNGDVIATPSPRRAPPKLLRRASSIPSQRRRSK